MQYMLRFSEWMKTFYIHNWYVLYSFHPVDLSNLVQFNTKNQNEFPARQTYIHVL